MPERPPESPPNQSPDGATPPSAWDAALLRAIDAGQLVPSEAADTQLPGAFAAHQKLEPLFAALRGEPGDGPRSGPSRRLKSRDRHATTGCLRDECALIIR